MSYFSIEARAQSPIETIFTQQFGRGGMFYRPEVIHPPIRRALPAYRNELPVITVYPPGYDRRGSGDTFVRRRGIPAVSEEQSLTENVGGPRAFCVRSCDGFFFPAPAGLGATRQESYCRSSCPGAETKLYSLRSYGTINSAADQRGSTYSKLSTAFQFRSKVSAACSCSGLLTNGLARLSITEDQTLRAGDAVMMQTGVRIFAGASRFPYAPADFVELGRYRRLSSHVAPNIASLQAIQTANAAANSVQQTASVQRRGARINPKHIAPQPSGEPAQVRVIDINHKMEKQQL